MNSGNEQKRITFYDFCLQSNKLDLLKEWDQDKNGDDKPWMFTYGSNKSVWWKCSKGHEWQSQIKSRTQGHSCPVCSGNILVSGINDLKTTYPNIAAEWHPLKNGKLLPTDVFAGTTKKFWWQCEKGHEWYVGVSVRTQGRDCPFCAGRKVLKGYNDLATLFPNLVKEWIAEKNVPLNPENVTAYSNKRVWWRCEKGHEWKAVISSRTSESSGCPYCSGRMVLSGFNDLATVYPKISAQWHPTMNGALTPEMVTSGSKKRVWWRCEDGHEWCAVICSRTGPRKHGCPICSGRFSKKKYKKIDLY